MAIIINMVFFNCNLQATASTLLSALSRGIIRNPNCKMPLHAKKTPP